MEKFCGLVAIILLCNLSLSSAATGTATYYTPPYTPSSCYGYEDKGTMIAAASDEIWDNRAACGRQYTVTCTGATNQGGYPCNGNSVVVTIVDYCPPPGCQATMDLSQEAFAAIANTDAGKILISY
ncbi:EG45-like domain containing protein [Platanthera zijinensis]|uniref:EG45-like domain containing protein n=1 Tax=Platanthera zijinensis TaxID=2320716 RepID=A0AAP0GEM0_9ASPA